MIVARPALPVRRVPLAQVVPSAVWWTWAVATDPALTGEGSPDLDAMVTAVIDRACMPGRRREPRLAEELVDAARVDVDTPHGTVAAWRVGEGPAVLLVHGYQDSARLWDPLMAALKTIGRAFVALDLPAHGFSGGERCMTGEVTDTVLAVAARLGPIDAAVAHSFATDGTTLATAEGAPMERLALIAPPGAYRTPSTTASGASEPGQQRWRRIAGELGFDASVGDRALEVYKASLGPARAEWSFADALADLPADVLLVASVDDERFDVGSARALAEHLPRGALVELAGLDHRASARDRTAVVAIVDFLQHGLPRDGSR
jgi:pimeloyl-ACP methyl ester carboxylesterase